MNREHAPIDLWALRRNLEGRTAILELFDVYLEETTKKLPSLEAAVAAENFAQIRDTAHSIKGSNQNLRAERMVGLLESIERMETNIALARERLIPIRAEFARICTFIAEYKKNTSEA